MTLLKNNTKLDLTIRNGMITHTPKMVKFMECGKKQKKFFHSVHLLTLMFQKVLL